MSKQRRLAISYSRFSDPKQAKGDSADRQNRMFRQFCQLHNLTPLPQVYADKGRSGYKDEHRKKGALGLLIAHAKDGKFEPGTVIVAEAWDRFGRLRPDHQVALIGELLKTGVALGVCRLNDIFTEEDFGSPKWTTLAVFVQLAYWESKQKAERVAASHERRRERARAGEGLGGWRLPAWVEKQDGKLVLIPERSKVVRRIFHLAADGMGYRRIIQTLTAEKVKPFGKVQINPDRVRSQFSGRWTAPYIALVLNDRRAVGELQPMKTNPKLGEPPVKDGLPIPNYFPAAVTEQEFQLAKAGQEQRRNKDKLGRRSGPRQGKYVNLFKSFLTHARDGQGFLLHNKGTAAHPELVLVNASGNEGRDRCYTFPYHVFEAAILHCLREVDPAKVLPAEKEAVSRVDELRAKLAHVRQEMGQLQEDLRGGYSKTLAALLREREDEEELVGNQLQEELARTAKPAERAWKELPTLADMIRKGGDKARLKLRAVLRQVIDSIWLVIVPHGDGQLVYLQVYFTGGNTREYLVGYWRGRKNRPAAWSVASWSDKWGTSHPRLALKDNPLRARHVAVYLGLDHSRTPVPPEQWDSLGEGDDAFTPGVPELLAAMRAAATPEGGSPDRELMGHLIHGVLKTGGHVRAGGPAVE